MSKVIICANQKGGVAKTTTAINVGIGLARNGKKVLIIDNDPQGSLTEALGYQQLDELDITISNIMEGIRYDSFYFCILGKEIKNFLTLSQLQIV